MAWDVLHESRDIPGDSPDVQGAPQFNLLDEVSPGTCLFNQSFKTQSSIRRCGPYWTSPVLGQSSDLQSVSWGGL